MILVRHSQPQIEPGLLYSQWRLTEEGQARCHALAARLVKTAPDAIYCSPEPKAVETAAILAAALGLSCSEIPELAEHDRSDVPFMAAAEFEAGITHFFQNPTERVFGRESAAEALQRFEVGLRATARGNQPVVVTHGTVMSLYLAKRTGLDPLVIWKSLATPCYCVCPQPAGDCSRIEYVGETHRLNAG